MTLRALVEDADRHPIPHDLHLVQCKGLDEPTLCDCIFGMARQYLEAIRAALPVVEAAETYRDAWQREKWGEAQQARRALRNAVDALRDELRRAVGGEGMR